MTFFPDPEQLEREALQALVSFRSARVLEIGAGDGRLTQLVAGDAAFVLGVDVDELELQLARSDYLLNWPQVPLVQAGAESLPFPAASFDLVMFSWSLCCVAPSGAVLALREAYRVAKSRVLDIRATLPPPDVWVRDRVGADTPCGPLTRRDGVEHNAAAVRAVEAALREGWFTVTAAREFDWIDSYDSGDDLIADVTDEWENWIIGEDLALRLARALERGGRSAAPYIKQGVRAQVLTKAQAGRV